MRLDLSVFGDVQVSREILRVGEHADDARPVWRAIAHDLLDIERKQFTTRGKRAHPWAALAPSTVQSKRRQRRRRGILESTGALRRAATLSGEPGQEIITHPAWMVFRLTLPYVRYHQHGTQRMPQRRVIDLTERDRRALVKKMQSWIVTGEIAGASARTVAARAWTA